MEEASKNPDWTAASGLLPIDHVWPDTPPNTPVHACLTNLVQEIFHHG